MKWKIKRWIGESIWYNISNIAKYYLLSLGGGLMGIHCPIIQLYWIFFHNKMLGGNHKQWNQSWITTTTTATDYWALVYSHYIT